MTAGDHLTTMRTDPLTGMRVDSETVVEDSEVEAVGVATTTSTTDGEAAVATGTATETTDVEATGTAETETEIETGIETGTEIGTGEETAVGAEMMKKTTAVETEGTAEGGETAGKKKKTLGLQSLTLVRCLLKGAPRTKIMSQTPQPKLFRQLLTATPKLLKLPHPSRSLMQMHP